MILCYSGTGNSRYIAQRIADELQDNIIDLNEKIKTNNYSSIETGGDVILVVPTYAWRIPKIVSNWLYKTKFIGAKRIWFVMNCGSEIGNATKYNLMLANDKHLDYMGTKQILMPEKAFCTISIWAKFSSKVPIIVIITIDGVIKPRVAIIPPKFPANLLPTNVEVFTAITPGVH